MIRATSLLVVLHLFLSRKTVGAAASFLQSSSFHHNSIRPPPRRHRDGYVVGQLALLDSKQDLFDKIKQLILAEDFREVDPIFEEMVLACFPGAISSKALELLVIDTLDQKGFTTENTLLATSFCCDEVNRKFEANFANWYGDGFQLGGLAGFPFAGRTGFAAMTSHIPVNGNCLIVYGTNVGMLEDGTIGKVHRKGVGAVPCCGSAIAASNYIAGIDKGTAQATTRIKSFTDFQQSSVQEMILPYAKRLNDAENRMIELPYALFESVDLLMKEIVIEGSAGLKKNTAMLGGVLINCGSETLDYFVPLRFDMVGPDGRTTEDLLDRIQI